MLADSSLGRKKELILSNLIMSISSLLTAFSTNVWMYSALWFINGFGRATVGTCALVLSTELVGKRWRERIGIIGFTCFALGFVSLPAIGFCLQGYSWRLIHISTCVPSLLYSLLVFFVHRWLFINGRETEFIETPRSIAAPTSRSSLTQSFFDDIFSESSHQVAVNDNNFFSAVRILLRRRWSCRRLVTVMVVGFGIGMIYYGTPLGLGTLSFDLYVSVALNALCEFPASFLTYLLMGNLDRKGSLLGLSLVSGISSVGSGLVRWKGMQIAVELVSFFTACTTVDLIAMYTLELFPTCVRNSAVSLVRQVVVFGGAVSPVLMATEKKNGLVSYGVFGVTTISMCGICDAFLPETRGTILCDTMEEEERKEKQAALLNYTLV